MRRLTRPIPCLHCGYDLRGVPLSCCPECGAAFCDADLARAGQQWAVLWREQVDHLRAARTLWIAMIGVVVVAGGAFGVRGDWPVTYGAVLTGLLATTGLAGVLAVSARVRSLLGDPDRQGHAPSGRLQVAVLTVTLPAFLIAVPCLAFVGVGVIGVLLVWLGP